MRVIEHHLITDAGGVPRAVLLTGGNRDDVTQLIPPGMQRCALRLTSFRRPRRTCR
jgi:hypothetical protein